MAAADDTSSGSGVMSIDALIVAFPHQGRVPSAIAPPGSNGLSAVTHQPTVGAPQIIKQLRASVLNFWAAGSSSSQHHPPLPPVASSAAASYVLPENRMAMWRLLLLGGTAPEFPSDFDSFVGTSAADAAAVEADAELSLNAANYSGDHAAAARQVQGMVEYLCTKVGRKYESTLTELATPLVAAADAAGRPLADIMPLLFVVASKVLPSAVAVGRNEAPLHELMRLVLQYHDPQLSVHCDRQHLNVGPLLTSTWLVNLFVSSSRDLRDVMYLWDVIFALSDYDPSVTIVFLALARFGLHRDALLQLHDVTTMARLVHRTSFDAAESEGAAAASASGSTLPPTWLRRLVADGRRILKFTPMSARGLMRLYLHALTLPALAPVVPAPASPNGGADPLQVAAGDTTTPAAHAARLLEQPVLPVTTDDMLAAFAVMEDGQHRPPHLNHVVLDCRAEKSFHHARLPTAIHVGNDVGFDPHLLAAVVERFDHAKGSHLTILGTGRGLNDESNLLKILALHFVTHGFPYVSYLDGGFRSIIPLIKAGRMEYTRTASTRPSNMESDFAGRGGAASSSNGSEPRRASPAPLPPPPPPPPPPPAPLAQPESQQAAPKTAVVASVIKEKATVATVKATEGLTAAKAWGMSLVKGLSSWRAGSGSAAPHGSEAELAARRDVASPPAEAAAIGTSSTEAHRPAVGPSAAAVHHDPVHPPATTLAGGGSDSPPPRFALPDDDDDGALDLITTLPVTTRAPPTLSTPLPLASVAQPQTPDPPKGAAPPPPASDDFDDIFK